MLIRKTGKSIQKHKSKKVECSYTRNRLSEIRAKSMKLQTGIDNRFFDFLIVYTLCKVLPGEKINFSGVPVF